MGMEVCSNTKLDYNKPSVVSPLQDYFPFSWGNLYASRVSEFFSTDGRVLLDGKYSLSCLSERKLQVEMS